jgi:hypothetical protein
VSPYTSVGIEALAVLDVDLRRLWRNGLRKKFLARWVTEGLPLGLVGEGDAGLMVVVNDKRLVLDTNLTRGTYGSAPK